MKKGPTVELIECGDDEDFARLGGIVDRGTERSPLGGEMTTTKHTKEPWTMTGCDYGEEVFYGGAADGMFEIDAEDDDGIWTATMPRAKSDPKLADKYRANADRIVACVNALAGLEPEEVEALPSAEMLRAIPGLMEDARRVLEEAGLAAALSCVGSKFVEQALAMVEKDGGS